MSGQNHINRKPLMNAQQVSPIYQCIGPAGVIQSGCILISLINSIGQISEFVKYRVQESGQNSRLNSERRMRGSADV